MYVTKPLSFYKNSPEFLSNLQHEGPDSGYLVIQDDEQTPTCFGLSNDLLINELPLPSNKFLKFSHGASAHEILAIPVINQPLSSNRYYVIKANRKHKGEAYVCSKEEDKSISCGKSCTHEEKPRRLSPQDMYQQIEFSQTITCTNNPGFSAKSILPDAHVQRSLKTISKLQSHRSTYSTPKSIIIDEANGLDNALRSQLPDFDFPVSRQSSTIVCIGKWHCPFMFIHDGKMEDQVKNNVFYVMTLEQKWERIFATDSTSYTQRSKVMMDVVVPIQVVAIGGKDGVVDERYSDNKVVWYRTIGSVGEELSVGLSLEIVERMIWEQKRVGWVNGKEKQVRIVREEEYGGIGWWVKFGCFVLVERFVLRRMDGSLVFTCDFKHTHQIKTKWE